MFRTFGKSASAPEFRQAASIAAKSIAHTKVPAWFDNKNGYMEDDQPGELYNLTTDLAQKVNLYAKKPAKVTELTALMKTILARGQSR